MPQDVRELGRKVKAKYPGKYDDLADDDLGRRVKAKYPGAYDDFTDTPAGQPPGNVENVGIGAARGALKSLVDPLLAIAEGWVSPQSSAQTGEQVARGAKQLVSQYVDPTGRLAAEQAPAIQAGQAKLAASRANSPGFRESKAAQDYLNARAALDPSLTGKITRGGAELATSALPAVATGAYGGIPMGAGVAALQSAAQPETAAFNVGASVALPAVGKMVAPILRRIRGGAAAAETPVATGIASQIRRTGAVEAAEGASVRAQPGVARLETPGSAQPLPVRQSLADGPMPVIEEAPLEDFTVALAKPGKTYPGARGPKVHEAVELELKKQADPSLVTKAERTPVLETISALRKAGLLTGIKTHIKNITGTAGFQLGEEISRIPGAVVDSLVSRVTKQRTLTGPSLGSVGRSAYEAATNGLAEAKSAIKTGRTRFDAGELQEIASGSKVIDTYVNGVFRLLKAEDAVFKSYALRRSLEDRARALALTEMRQGKITRGQIGQRAREIFKAPPDDMANAAMLDAEVATFNNPNVVSDAFGSALERLPKGAQFAADLIVPFRKTPTNVIARMIDYSPLGLVKSAGQGAKLANGILKKSFTAEQQRAFAQTFGRASFGSALMALGYIGYRDGWLTGLQEDDTSRRSRDVAAGRTPGAILIGKTWHQLSGFAPLGNILAVGASLARETEQEQEGFLDPVSKITAQAIGDQPLLIGTQQIASALKEPGTTSERLLGGLAGSFVPTMASDVAQLIDPRQREARGILPQVQKRIPGASFGLPEAQNVLGQPKEDRMTAFIDPTRTSTDVAQRDPLMRELVRLDAGISGFQREEGEPDDAYRAKVQAFGQLYTRYGQALVSSAAYQRASDEIKLRAVKSLNDRAKDAAREGRASPGNLSPAALIGAAISAQTRENRKNAGRK